MPYKKLEDRILWQKQYYQANREKKLQQAKERYLANKPPPTERLLGKATTDPAAYQREWAQAHPEQAKTHARRYYLKGYDLTEEKYAAILAAQGGICALCLKDDPGALGKKLHIDHDHVTGKVRGLLCMGHNTALGKFGDSIEGLERALAYLQRQSCLQEPPR